MQHTGASTTRNIWLEPATALNINLDWYNSYFYLFRPGIVLFVRGIDQIIIFLILRDKAHHPKIIQLSVLLINAYKIIKRAFCISCHYFSSLDSQSVGANSDKKLVLEFIYWLWNVIGHYSVRGAEPIIMSSSHLVITIFMTHLTFTFHTGIKADRIKGRLDSIFNASSIKHECEYLNTIFFLVS